MNISNSNESVKIAIRIAQSLAKEYHNSEFTPAHLLKALMHKEVSLYSFLTAINKDATYIAEWAEVRIESLEKTAQVADEVKGSKEIARVFEEADHIRLKIGADLINPVCVLAALCKPTVGFTVEQLKSFPLKERDVLDGFMQDEVLRQVIAPSDQTSTKPGTGVIATTALYKYCIDRLAPAREGKTDPIIGRDKELRMMMEILCRRTKPNVIITGDAGVGKTALVDGFAADIVAGEVPEQLKHTQLFELDLGALIAGASYKGETEDRLKNILKEIKQFDKAVLFIDEIHTLDSKGPLGAGIGNLLKPELARGEITVIGATTLEEYRKYIEPEQAFSRRFEVLQIGEPTAAAAIRMLEKLSGRYAAHHHLQIQPAALADCVHLAKRYMKDRRLPDAAFDLLDRTLAAIRLMNDTSTKILDDLQIALQALLSAETPASLSDYQWLYTQLKDKVSPVLLGQLQDETAVAGFETNEQYQEYLSRTLLALQQLATVPILEVSGHEIAAIVSYKTGIPLGKIQSQEREKLLNMVPFLKNRVVGQDHALKVVADAILESRSGLNKKGQPIGSFFLLGPTGTGKTELAKSIAEFYSMTRKP
ncbi:AAA family ATPase [Chitinophaga pinensis]|uniref:AAA family ATPase n=1 Tax=Chitinophaga pinensis TaxID=79329 RepID=UPI0021BD32EC|nr:ATP-dependent Clp protease ATP-binding subunit [Chitinophaga pinensis]